MLSHHERTNMAISRSGLPKTVLELFDPREDLEYKTPIERKKPALPLVGLAAYMGHFPGADDEGYQPARNEIGQKDPEERKFRNKEYHLQAAVEALSILERCGCPPPLHPPSAGSHRGPVRACTVCSATARRSTALGAAGAAFSVTTERRVNSTASALHGTSAQPVAQKAHGTAGALRSTILQKVP